MTFLIIVILVGLYIVYKMVGVNIGSIIGGGIGLFIGSGLGIAGDGGAVNGGIIFAAIGFIIGGLILYRGPNNGSKRF